LTEPIRPGLDDFFGAVNVGERGQIVIPAEARKKLDIHTGDKLLVLGHPAKNGLMLVKIGAMREFLNDLATKLNLAESEHVGPDSE
jgi:AbrB family looped-hinge helix DNA binding protein